MDSVAMFHDEANPTDDENRRWAYSDALEPMQDFDIILGEPEHLPLLLDLVADAECPKRRFALDSLYCLVGHTRLPNPAIAASVAASLSSADPWVRTWATRAAEVLANPTSRNRDEWCGWQGYRTRPVEA